MSEHPFCRLTPPTSGAPEPTAHPGKARPRSRIKRLRATALSALSALCLLSMLTLPIAYGGWSQDLTIRATVQMGTWCPADPIPADVWITPRSFNPTGNGPDLKVEITLASDVSPAYSAHQIAVASITLRTSENSIGPNIATAPKYKGNGRLEVTIPHHLAEDLVEGQLAGDVTITVEGVVGDDRCTFAGSDTITYIVPPGGPKSKAAQDPGGAITGDQGIADDATDSEDGTPTPMPEPGDDEGTDTSDTPSTKPDGTDDTPTPAPTTRDGGEEPAPPTEPEPASDLDPKPQVMPTPKPTPVSSAAPRTGNREPSPAPTPVPTPKPRATPAPVPTVPPPSFSIDPPAPRSQPPRAPHQPRETREAWPLTIERITWACDGEDRVCGEVVVDRFPWLQAGSEIVLALEYQDPATGAWQPTGDTVTITLDRWQTRYDFCLTIPEKYRDATVTAALRLTLASETTTALTDQPVASDPLLCSPPEPAENPPPSDATDLPEDDPLRDPPEPAAPAEEPPPPPPPPAPPTAPVEAATGTDPDSDTDPDPVPDTPEPDPDPAPEPTPTPDDPTQDEA